MPVLLLMVVMRPRRYRAPAWYHSQLAAKRAGSRPRPFWREDVVGSLPAAFRGLNCPQWRACASLFQEPDTRSTP